MCPPKVVEEIGPLWTDEELFDFLRSIQKRSPGASLPRDVLAEFNPYVHVPSRLPVSAENVWYLVHSEEPKQSEAGFWKAKDDPCQIYSGSSIIGWRTTLEFFEGLSPNGHQTDWLMQEYSISHKGSNRAKGEHSLCRVFLSDRDGENHKLDQVQANDGVRGQNNLLHDEGNKKLQADMGNQAIVLPHEDLLHADCLATGDYLALEDLLDPLSSSSSSDNSSCVSRSSEVCFDAVALLEELEQEDEICQTKLSGCKCSISRPNEMAVCLTAEGSPIDVDNNKTAEPVKAETCSTSVSTREKGAHGEDHISQNTKKRPPPNSNDAGASSSRHRPGADKGKKAYRGKMIKKLFCFIAL